MVKNRLPNPAALTDVPALPAARAGAQFRLQEVLQPCKLIVAAGVASRKEIAR